MELPILIIFSVIGVLIAAVSVPMIIDFNEDSNSPRNSSESDDSGLARGKTKRNKHKYKKNKSYKKHK